MRKYIYFSHMIFLISSFNIRISAHMTAHTCSISTGFRPTKIVILLQLKFVAFFFFYFLCLMLFRHQRRRMMRRRSRTWQTALPECNPLLRGMPHPRAPTPPMLTGASRKRNANNIFFPTTINFYFLLYPNGSVIACCKVKVEIYLML